MSLIKHPADSYILEKAGARTTVVARSNYEQVKGSEYHSKLVAMTDKHRF